MSRPQTNGQVESAIKEILNSIKKKIEREKRSWDEELPGILGASRTTVKKATSHTPFSLIYGLEVMLPIEIRIPSTRVTYYSYNENDNDKRVNLDLLPESQGNAPLRSIAQKKNGTPIQHTCQDKNHNSWRLGLTQDRNSTYMSRQEP